MLHKLVTEQQRHTWSALVLVVGLSTLPMSLSLLALTVYIRFMVDEELELVQGMHTATLPYFLAVTGTINFMCNLLLVSTMARAHRPSSREPAIRALLVAILIDLGSTILVFSACIVCFVQLALLASSFQAGLTEAMKQYGSVPHVKVRLDELQMDYDCCGDSGYQDWFRVPWVPESMLLTDPKEIQANLGEGNEYTNDDVPFSCCDPSSPRPCIHHHVASDHLHYLYDHRHNTTLYVTGCRQALMDFFGRMILKNVALSLLMMTLVQSLVVAVSRLLQTSMQNAIAQGNVTGTALGYLWMLPPGPKKDEESGGGGGAGDMEKQALLAEGAESQPSADTTDTEGDTTTEEPSSLVSSGEPPTDDLETTPATDDEPLYENIPAEESPYDDLGAQPLFPSEMEGNRNLNYHASAAASTRLRSNGSISSSINSSSNSSSNSKAFNSLGMITPPHHYVGVPPPVNHHHHNHHHHHRFPPGHRC